MPVQLDERSSQEAILTLEEETQHQQQRRQLCPKEALER